MTPVRFRWLLSRRWLFVPPLLIGVTVVAVLASSQKELPRAETTQETKPVHVVRAAFTDVYPAVVGFGTAKAKRTWTATAEVSGQVIATHPYLRSGRIVEAGETLLQIDRADYELRVDQRTAELSQAKAQLEQLKLNVQSDEASLEIQQDLLAVQQDDLVRLEQLSQRSVASQSEFDSAKSAFLQQQQAVQNLLNSLRSYPAQIKSAEAGVRLADLRVAEARRDLERTTIVAPFRGVLADVSIEQDQYVALNQSLFDVLDISTMEVEAHFSIAQLNRVIDHRFEFQPVSESEPRYGSSKLSSSMKRRYADATAGGLSDRMSTRVTLRSGDVCMSFPATPIRFSESLDEQTRTLGIVVEVTNDPAMPLDGANTLRPGAYCEIQLRSDRAIHAISVPRANLDEEAVFIVDRDNTLKRRELEIAMTLRDQVAVVGGLNEGDLIVARPSASLMPGDLVDPLPVESRPVDFRIEDPGAEVEP